jgi:hypothetical protein
MYCTVLHIANLRRTSLFQVLCVDLSSHLIMHKLTKLTSSSSSNVPLEDFMYSIVGFKVDGDTVKRKMKSDRMAVSVMNRLLVLPRRYSCTLCHYEPSLYFIKLSNKDQGLLTL